MNSLARTILAFVTLFATTAVEAREIEIASTRVTSADVAVSPDGASVVFAMLGHLFRVPAAGGAAEQLTFGPAFDKEPVYSPDGAALAFVSDRDGSESNIFMLSLRTGQLSQLTHETWADIPTFSPDGRAILYGRHVPETLGSFPTRDAERLICRVALAGGPVEVLTTPPRHLGSIFFLPDGRLAWTSSDRDGASGDYVTHIEALSAVGITSTLLSVSGLADWVVAPAQGDTVYAHRVTGSDYEEWIPAATEDVIAVPLNGGPTKALLPVSGQGRFAISADGANLYLGDRGRLYKVALPAGTATPVDFRANVKLVVRERAAPMNVVAPAAGGVRAVQTPRLSPDGRTLVFGAAGFLWRQSLEGGPAGRVTQGDVRESSPAFSPNGQTLAYVATDRGVDSIMLLDLDRGETRTLHTGVGIGSLNFSRDGKRLLATVNRSFLDESVIAIEVASTATESLFPVTLWSPRPSFAADGRSVYFSSDSSGVGNVYRVALTKGAAPEAITRFADFASDAQLTPDDRTLVFRRNRSIFTVPLTAAGADERAVRELSPEGGDAFAMTPDGAGVIYAVGPRVWIQPLAGKARHELVVRLMLPPAVPPTTLVKHVRLLDFNAGGFGGETSLLLKGGRILHIGDAAAEDVPPGTQVLDARGRYAIPGLFEFHAHTGDANPEAFIGYGITSLRDTGYNLDQLTALQDRNEHTGAALPRYFYAGELFEGARPYWGDRGSLLITNERDARDYVRRFKALGVSFIKVYPSLSWRLQRVVIDEARRQGLPVVGHGTSIEEITKSAILGLYSLEHTNLTGPVYDDVLAMLAATGTHWDPTLTCMGADSLLLRDRPEELADPRFVGFTPPSYLQFATLDAYNGVATPTLRGVVAAELDSVRRAARFGVRLHAGSDAPNPKCFFGSSLHWELERFVEAGLTPLEVLRIASLDAAIALGREDLGSLEVGKAADLVLLDRDPLADIRNSRSVWRVVKNGWMFDPDLLLAPSARDHLSGSSQAPIGAVSSRNAVVSHGGLGPENLSK
jgi:imidazolonepropionase-like amidohydrolase/Tol biopolymer transport system component